MIIHGRRPQPIFPAGSNQWHKYVLSKRIEITCGEAPYLVSPYDTTTGKIIPINQRIGQLDRKLRVINENMNSERYWFEWVIKAYQSTYGYEYQGDNLLLARENLLYTFIDNYKFKFGKEPNIQKQKKIAQIITWNIWQMDGLSDCAPFSSETNDFYQMGLFGNAPIPCRVIDWANNLQLHFKDLKKGTSMKYFAAAFNPPYQETREKTSDKPAYNLFMDAAFNIADKTVVITPARFLFNNGNTPKEWNQKMLSDKHFRVVQFFPNSKQVFPNTDIKGGVVISFRDNEKTFEPIGIFTPFNELNSILNKVLSQSHHSLTDIAYSSASYRLTDKFHEQEPKSSAKLSNSGKHFVTSNVFELLGGLSFFDEKPNDEAEYIRVYGREKNQRKYMYVQRDYIKPHENLDFYKVFIPKSNGSGSLGEVLSTPVVGHTQTFMSIGKFETKYEAESLMKYIKTKFARCLLGVLKSTQDNPLPVWKHVPLQDLTKNSDIDWSKSIHEIDLQLYKKYGLNEEEIDFIETHVREMA